MNYLLRKYRLNIKKKKNDKIRLLFCINSLSAKGGGAEKILSIISNELSHYNTYEIHILTFDQPYEKLFYNFLVYRHLFPVLIKQNLIFHF